MSDMSNIRCDSIRRGDIISCKDRFDQVFRVANIDHYLATVYIADHATLRSIPFMDITGHWENVWTP